MNKAVGSALPEQKNQKWDADHHGHEQIKQSLGTLAF